MKFCIIHFNTPELTTCLCASINKFHDDAEIIILDNSDNRPFKNENLFYNVMVLDNTKQQLVNFSLNKFVTDRTSYERVMKSNKCGSAKHALSIQFLLDYLNEDFILLDSDVLLKKSVYDIINQNYVCSANIIEKAIPSRTAPFIIYFNTKMIKDNDIKFFNKNYMIGLSGMKYDTGAYFLEMIIKNKLKINRINYNDYILHYGNGSWKSDRKTYTFKVQQNSWQEFLLKNKNLYK